MNKNIKKIVNLMMIVSICLLVGSIFIYKKSEHVILKTEVSSDDFKVLEGGTLSGTLTENTYLSKGDYTISTDLIIPEGIILEIQEGSNITFSYNKKIIVRGRLNAWGYENEKIVFNYEWSNTSTTSGFIFVEESGNVQMEHVTLKNKSSTSYTTITFNNKGSLNLDYINLEGNSVTSRGKIINNGMLDLRNSNIYFLLLDKNSSNNLTIENNIISNKFQVQLEGCDAVSLAFVRNNYIQENNLITIELLGDMTKNVILYKNNYIMKKNFNIPFPNQLSIEAGTNLNLENYSMIVEGFLNLWGNNEENVNINYNIGSGSRKIFLNIKDSGWVDAKYTNITNINKNQTSIAFDIIKNDGTLEMDHSNLLVSSSVHQGNLTNNYKIKLTNSTLPYRLIINEESNVQLIENNVIQQGFEVSFGSRDDAKFLNIKENYNSNGDSKQILLLNSPSSNVKLSKHEYLVKYGSNLIVPKNTVFEVEAGTIIKLPYGKNVNVYGILNLSGKKTEPVIITNETGLIEKPWNTIRIETSGTMIVGNSEIEYGGWGTLVYPIDNYGKLIMWNSKISNNANNEGIHYYNAANSEQILMNNAILGTLQADIPIIAPNNYWGAENGPRRKDPDTNTYIGDGFSVNENVYFTPYTITWIKNDIDSYEFLMSTIPEMPYYGRTGVDFYTGNYGKQYVDFELSSNIELDISRTYNSKNTESGILGYGWTFGLSSKVEKHPYIDNSYIVYLENGSIDVFTKQEDNTYKSKYSRNSFEIVDNKYVYKKQDQTIYTYSNNGNLESITDKYDNNINLVYNNGLLTEIIEFNRKYTLEYNENNLLSKITDPIGRTVKYYYTNNLLTKVTNVNNIDTIYTYNESNQLIEIKENNNIVLKLEYIIDGYYKNRVLKQTDETGNVITYSYDSTERLTTETDSSNRVTKKYFDANGYIIKRVNPDGTFTTTTYNLINGSNLYGEVSSSTNINSATITYLRDGLGRITGITNPDNTVKQYFYNDKNNVIKEIDELGNVTEYIYDTDGVTLLKEVKLLNETSYSEEADQNLFVITSYTYYNPSEVSNIKGLIKTINGKDGLITYTYDNYGNIKTKI